MSLTTYSAVNAAKFAASLGACAHLAWTNTPYGNPQAVGSAMSYLGFQNLRDGAIEQMQSLAGQGLRFDVVVATPVKLSEFHSRIVRLESAYPGSVISIEGPNEVDGWPVTYNGKTGYGGAIAQQADLYKMIKSDPLFAHTPVYNFSVGAWGSTVYQQLGNQAAHADGQPMHLYYGGGQASWIWQQGLDYGHITVPGGLNVVTETGSSTAPLAYWGVSEAVQAKQSLNVVMDAARTGTTTYFYELVDQATVGGDPLQSNYGLFRGDWSPKPAATALHNLTRILTRGADASVAPASISYSVRGLPTWEGYTMAFAKSATTHDIAIWLEPDLWDDKSHTEIKAPSHQVTITLASTYDSVDVYDPLVGTEPVQHLKSVNAVTVNVTDHPIIVEVKKESL